MSSLPNRFASDSIRGRGEGFPTRRHASEGWHPDDGFAKLRRMKHGWVYIMTNKPFGTLYVGVTSNLPARVMQHREGTGSSFCKEHGLRRLVYAEKQDSIQDAIAREKAMKAWKRVWKTRLIEAGNPGWDDLFDSLNG